MDNSKIEDNHLDVNSSFDGKMFETFGPELEYVKSKIKENKVITIIEGDEGMYYVSGFHYVNRLGYLVNKKPLSFEFEVKLD